MSEPKTHLLSEPKLNVRALAAMSKISIEELARRADIDPDHLKSVSSGRATMTGRDLINLAVFTGVSPFQIAIEQ